MKPAQLCFFFFQAEDGIRDIGVTGVQTCALPISSAAPPAAPARSRRRGRARAPLEERRRRLAWVQKNNRPQTTEIGRASCRERVKMLWVGLALEKQRELLD